MPLLAVTNLKYSIGTRVLLDGVSFSIEAGERIGLVGRNGCGKTTLMRAIMGRVTAESGRVDVQKGARVGYLSQDPELNLDNTLLAEAIAGFAELSTLHEELDEVFHEMALPENGTPERLERLMRRQADLQERIDAWGEGGGGGYAIEHKAEAVLHGLGFVDAQFGIKVRDLSGGQKGRLALAKLLLESPDLLLLDEPTNHLDIAGREWLEEFLRSEYSGAVILISHDRYLLDRVVDRIEEVERGRLIEYPGNYTAFVDIRKQRLLTQHRAYENQQSRWAKEEEFIRRFRAGQRAKEAQGRLSKLEREKEQEAIERPLEMGTLRMELPEAPRTGEQVVSVRNAGKWYPAPAASDAAVDNPEPQHVRREKKAGDKVLFHDLDFSIARGERWGVIGPNGAGKTTLVRAILDELPLSAGQTKIGYNVVIGYFQQLPPGVDDELRVYEYLQMVIRRENPGKPLSEQAARNLAGAFLFTGEDQEKPMGALSGGERGRARLAALLACAKNLLVLDEPTNHLDIPSSERLEQALAPTSKEGAYDGALVLISHDRALIDATCDHLLILDGTGGVTVFHGNYSAWQRKRAEQASGKAATTGWTAPPTPTKSEPKGQKAPVAGSGAAVSNGTPTGKKKSGGGGGGGGGGKYSWMPVDKLEAEIGRVTARLKAADDELASEEVYRDAKRCNALLDQREKVAAELESLEAEWLRRAG
ncbi:MAG: ABC-F family ATP-binding cassette domain-containing protein [Phycisphaerales bacterium]|nr:ABC-F family ATP-binding cassette domain-containing protein [Phycisphaerales bacterium]